MDEVARHPLFEPLGLSRVEAAYYVGMSGTKFDELVEEGLMPQPRKAGRRKIWIRTELEIALKALPRPNEPNPWDNG